MSENVVMLTDIASTSLMSEELSSERIRENLFNRSSLSSSLQVTGLSTSAVKQMVDNNDVMVAIVLIATVSVPRRTPGIAVVLPLDTV